MGPFSLENWAFNKSILKKLLNNKKYPNFLLIICVPYNNDDIFTRTPSSFPPSCSLLCSFFLNFVSSTTNRFLSFSVFVPFFVLFCLVIGLSFFFHEIFELGKQIFVKWVFFASCSHYSVKIFHIYFWMWLSSPVKIKKWECVILSFSIYYHQFLSNIFKLLVKGNSNPSTAPYPVHLSTGCSDRIIFLSIAAHTPPPHY